MGLVYTPCGLSSSWLGWVYSQVLARLQERDKACKVSCDIDVYVTNDYLCHILLAKERYKAVIVLERKEIDSTTIWEWLQNHIRQKKNRELCKCETMEAI